MKVDAKNLFQYRNMNKDELWNNWKEHRSRICKMIEYNIFLKENVTNKSIAILGAGQCNDIDLNFLLKYAENITLFDIDVDACQVGIERQNLSNNPNIKIHKAFDFIGLDHKFYDEYYSQLKENCSISVLKRIIIEAADSIKKPEINEKFDVVISMATHSQLINGFSYPIRDDKTFDDLGDAFSDIYKKGIDTYNSLLFSLVNKGGTVFILNEVVEIDNNFLEEFINNYYNFMNTPSKMLEFIWTKYPDLLLSSEEFCHLDIQHRTDIDVYYLHSLWEFSISKLYYAFIYICYV